VLNVVAKVKLNMFPESKVMLLVVVVPVGSVMLTRTVSRKLSVTFVVMLKSVPWLPVVGSAVTFLTSGMVISLTTNVSVSVLFTFPAVSFAMMVAV